MAVTVISNRDLRPGGLGGAGRADLLRLVKRQKTFHNGPQLEILAPIVAVSACHWHSTVVNYYEKRVFGSQYQLEERHEKSVI